MSNPAVQNVTAAVSQQNARIERAAHRDPRGGRRDAQAKSQHQVRERGEALGEGIEKNDRQRQRAPAQAQRIQLARGEEQEQGGQRLRSPRRSAAESSPAGSARILVRGLRASMSASITRLNAMAADRAPTIATTIHSSLRQILGDAKPLSRNASSAPVRAKGRAKTECSNLIISSVSRMRFQNANPLPF